MNKSWRFFSNAHLIRVNTPPDILQIIRDTGIQTPDTIRYLGVQLGINMEETIKATIAHINPKAIKRRIMATTPPTDLVHRATLINRALIPIYNHVFMSLPITNQITTDLCTDITSFLWTKQREGQTVAKRRLVAKNRISASFGMGGLQIPDPQTTVEGLQINLLQKLFKRNCIIGCIIFGFFSNKKNRTSSYGSPEQNMEPKIFFNFFGRVPALRWGSESTYISKV